MLKGCVQPTKNLPYHLLVLLAAALPVPPPPVDIFLGEVPQQPLEQLIGLVMRLVLVQVQRGQSLELIRRLLPLDTRAREQQLFYINM